MRKPSGIASGNGAVRRSGLYVYSTTAYDRIDTMLPLPDAHSDLRVVSQAAGRIGKQLAKSR